MSNHDIRRLGAAIALALGSATWTTAVLAQHEGHGAAAEQTAPAGEMHPMDHTQHMEHTQHAEHAASPNPVPPLADADRAAAFPDLGAVHMAHDMHDDPLNKGVLLNRFEAGDADDSVLQWDLDAWIGKSLTRLWIRTEGERVANHTERADLEFLWGKGIARWWDFVAGARHDFAPGTDRDWAAVGVRGLAPYRFDIEATAYVGDGGRAAFRFESQYEVLVTNRLILQPLLELTWNAQSDATRGAGTGLADAEFGVRLRYEFRREVAPYVGLVRERKFGRTADLARAAGLAADDTELVAGVRLSF
jgi:copper resistance protein B